MSFFHRVLVNSILFVVVTSLSVEHILKMLLGDKEKFQDFCKGCFFPKIIEIASIKMNFGLN
jgi:hypothetical protein